MEDNTLKLTFSFADEFGQESTLNKTFTTDIYEVTPQFELLIEEFKKFLLATGFSVEHVDQVQIVEE